jgi:hypothetical protein
MKRYLVAAAAALLACHSDSTAPAQDTIEATVIQVFVTTVVGVQTTTPSPDIRIDVSTLGYRDPNDPCNGLYSVHLQPTTTISYSDALGVAVDPSAIVAGEKIRVSPATPATTGCKPTIEATSIVVIRP